MNNDISNWAANSFEVELKFFAYHQYSSDLVDQLSYIVFTELAVLTTTLIISN